MNLREAFSFRLLTAVAGLAGALACVHCSASSEALSSFNPKPDQGGEASATSPDAGSLGVPNDRSPQAPPSSGVTALDSNVLLVNAATSFSAFRVCPAVAGTTASASRSAPQPTTLMPQSSLAGVDVNGATALPPQADFADASDVLVLRVDDDTKNNPALETGTCQTLSCTNGAGCIGANKIFRVPVLEGGLPSKGAFAKKGNVLALRGSPPNLRFDVLPIVNQALQNKAALRVEYRNLSADYTGKVEFRAAAGEKATALTEGAGTEVLVGKDYFAARFEAGALVSTLDDIHQLSDPRVAISDFYASPGTFALLLLGQASDAGPTGGLRFLIVPVSSRTAGSPADAGTD